MTVLTGLGGVMVKATGSVDGECGRMQASHADGALCCLRLALCSRTL